MSRIVVIHGFGCHIQYNIFGKLIKPNLQKEFSAFSDNCSFFEWGIASHFDIWQAMQTKSYTSLYKQEKILAKSREIQIKLNQFLIQEKPTTIVCHSMGSYLLINYLKNHQLINSVKKIILIQSDLNTSDYIDTRNTKERKSTIFKKIKNNLNQVKIYNYYCPWDPALIYSWFYNQKLPLGLHPNNIFQSKLFPLYPIGNTHSQSLKNKKLIKSISEISK